MQSKSCRKRGLALNGAPLSPLFNGSIESEFNYSVLTPAPSSLALLAAAGTLAVRRRR